jgi:hypothetical protein
VRDSRSTCHLAPCAEKRNARVLTASSQWPFKRLVLTSITQEKAARSVWPTPPYGPSIATLHRKAAPRPIISASFFIVNCHSARVQSPVYANNHKRYSRRAPSVITHSFHNQHQPGGSVRSTGNRECMTFEELQALSLRLKSG